MQGSGLLGLGVEVELRAFCSVLGLLTCLLARGYHLNNRRTGRSLNTELGSLGLLLTDFSYDFFILRRLLSFFYFWVLWGVYSISWFVFLYLLIAGKFEFLQLLIGFGVLLGYRLLTEMFIALVKVAENTSVIAYQMRPEDEVSEEEIQVIHRKYVPGPSPDDWYAPGERDW